MADDLNRQIASLIDEENTLFESARKEQADIPPAVQEARQVVFGELNAELSDVQKREVDMARTSAELAQIHEKQLAVSNRVMEIDQSTSDRLFEDFNYVFRPEHSRRRQIETFDALQSNATVRQRQQTEAELNYQSRKRVRKQKSDAALQRISFERTEYADVQNQLAAVRTQRKELQATQDREFALRAAESAQKLRDEQLLAVSREQYFNTLTLDELDQFIGQAGDAGVVTVDGTPFTFDVAELNARAVKLRKARAESLLATSAKAAAESAMDSGWRTMVRIAYGSAYDDMSALDSAMAVVQRNDAPPEMLAAAKTVIAIQQHMAATDDENVQLQGAGIQLKAMAEAQAAMEKARMETMPKAQQPVAQEFYRLGKVQNQEYAVTAATQAAVYGESMGLSKGGTSQYDKVLAELHQSIAGGLAAASGDRKGVAAQRAITESLALDPEEIAARNLIDPDARDTIQAAGLQSAMFDLFKQTALAINDPAIYEQITTATSAMYTNGLFAPDLMIQHIAGLGEGKLRNFIVTMKREMARFGQLAFTPSGENAHMQAAINKAVYNNNATELFIAQVTNVLNESLKAVAAQTSGILEKQQFDQYTEPYFAP